MIVSNKAKSETAEEHERIAVSGYSDNEEVALEVPTQEEVLTENNRTYGKLNFGGNFDIPYNSDPLFKMETPKNKGQSPVSKTVEEGENESITIDMQMNQFIDDQAKST